MRVLAPHKKWGRPKIIPGTYISIPNASIGKTNTDKISLDKSNFSNSDILLN